MTAQRGSVIKVGAGWSIRWRDATGRRRQRGVYRLKSEAQAVLDDELQKVRLGALYRPDLTLDELVAAFLDQYEASAGSRTWLSYYLRFSQAAFGQQRIATLDAHQIGAWRSKLKGLRGEPASDHMKHAALRALRQVLEAALRWGWIEKNPASLVRNEAARPSAFTPFESWAEIDAIAAELGAVDRAVVVFAPGTGLRPEEWCALRRADVDLDARVVRVHRAYAKGAWKEYPKTSGSRRTVPLRARVHSALTTLFEAYDASTPPDGITRAQQASALVFPGERGAPIRLNNWRRREWADAQAFAGITPIRRPYDLRHTYATWSLAAGVGVFQLSRRMGTSVGQISKTYGHLLADADSVERGLLDTWDEGDAS